MNKLDLLCGSVSILGGDIIKIENEIDKNIGKKAYKKSGLFSGLIGVVEEYDGGATGLQGYGLIFSNGGGLFSKLEDLVFVDEEKV